MAEAGVIHDPKELEAAIALQGLSNPLCKRRGKLQKHSFEKKQKAWELKHKHGYTTSQIARKLEVSTSCAHDWSNRQAWGVHGNERLLTETEEEWLVDHIKRMARFGHGFGYTETRLEVGHLLRNDKARSAKLVDGIPSEYNSVSF